MSWFARVARSDSGRWLLLVLANGGQSCGVQVCVDGNFKWLGFRPSKAGGCCGGVWCFPDRFIDCVVDAIV